MKNLSFEDAYHLQIAKVEHAWKTLFAVAINKDFLNECNPAYKSAMSKLEGELAALWRIKQLWQEVSE